MAITYYCIQAITADADVTPAMSDRSTALGCQLVKGDPTGEVTVWPSVVIVGKNSTPVVIPDDTGQASASEVSTALTNAETAEANYTSAISSQATNLTSLIGSLSAQITQAQTDLATLATSTDPLAPILARVVEATLALAQGVTAVGSVSGHIDPTKIPKI